MAEDGYSGGTNESEKTLKQKLNKHIQHLQQHTHNNNPNTNNCYTSNNSSSILSNDSLKMYIDYCKKYCHPVLTRSAAKILQVYNIPLNFPLILPTFPHTFTLYIFPFPPPPPYVCLTNLSLISALFWPYFPLILEAISDDAI